MPCFRPLPGMVLPIGSTYFEFVPHPLLPYDKEALFVLEGGEALVYQIHDVDTRELYALKVFKPSYRGEHIARVVRFLVQQTALPGLYLKHYTCLTRSNYPGLISTYPDLEYAILMPWIQASTWAGLLINQELSAHYTFNHARDLTLATANVLWNLESSGLAHADIAGGNILLSAGRKQVLLLDLEGMFVPGMPAPKKLSRGSPGYQHRRLGVHGQWCPHGDRFAGAVLLTEMLTWWDPRIRALVANEAETLFLPEELQIIGTPRWLAVRNVLYSIHPNILALFDQAWTSSSLAECPDLATWAMTLLSDFL